MIDRVAPGFQLRRCLLLSAAALMACAACQGSADPALRGFPTAPPPRPYSPAQSLKEFDASLTDPYRLGEGDQVSIQVWDKAELSGTQFVGPDGVVTIPVIGSVRISGLTREEAAGKIKDSLARLYSGVSVTVKVEQYLGNRITVLGRVKTQGVLRFETVPSLLDAIARAGGLADGPVNLSHCAVLRGRDRVAWIDLSSLMDGRDMALNLRLKPDDVVLVPEDGDLPVYVLGQVMKPGPYRYTRGMTVLDAVAQAGGIGRDGQSSKILVVRPSQNRRIVVSLSDVLAPEASMNVGVERGDIVFVPSSALADVGYFLEKLNAFSWIFVAQAVK